MPLAFKNQKSENNAKCKIKCRMQNKCGTASHLGWQALTFSDALRNLDAPIPPFKGGYRGVYYSFFIKFCIFHFAFFI